MKKIILVFYAVLALVACKMAASGLQILSGDFDFPKLTSLSSECEGTVDLEFSKPVAARNLAIYRLEGAVEPDFGAGLSLQKNGECLAFFASQTAESHIQVTLEEKSEPGEKFGIDGVVEDERGNSLSFSGVVTGFNSRVPEKIYLSEIRTTKSGARTKFIELKVASDGNLAGVCLLTAGNSTEASRFEFPALEVKSGDVVVVHILPKETEPPKSELHTKKESKSEFATDGWDFFTTDDSLLLSSTGVCLVETRAAGPIADAALFCPSGREKWTKQIQEDLARRAFDSGKWERGFLPANAFASDKLSSGAAAVRKNFESFCPEAWERVTASKATPGK